MSAKKKKRHKLIEDIVLERGALSVGALAEVLDVSTQTIRRDVFNDVDRLKHFDLININAAH